MILYSILILAGVAAIAGISNMVENRKARTPKVIPMEIRLPGNLPIIALSSNGTMFNFLLDSGSNISHICPEYSTMLDAAHYNATGGDVRGLGANNSINEVCRAILGDSLGNKYEVDMVVSEGFVPVANSIEDNTGIKVHGLLGTDFLNKYNYTIDFKALKVYPQK